MSDSSEPATTPSTTSDFVVDQVKSNFFRVVYAEGFEGGVTGGDNIHVAFWNSRDAIKKRLIYKFDSEDKVIDVVEEARADQVREVEIGLLMGRDTARALAEWLTTILNEEFDEPTLEEVGRQE